MCKNSSQLLVLCLVLCWTFLMFILILWRINVYYAIFQWRNLLILLDWFYYMNRQGLEGRWHILSDKAHAPRSKGQRSLKHRCSVPGWLLPNEGAATKAGEQVKHMLPCWLALPRWTLFPRVPPTASLPPPPILKAYNPFPLPMCT